MDYISIKCPNCGKELKVPTNAENIVCMFCAKPINIGALAENKSVADEKNAEALSAVEEARNALPSEIFTFKISLDQMNAKVYPTVFKNFEDIMVPFWQPFNRAVILDRDKTLEEISELLFSGYTGQLCENEKKYVQNNFLDIRFTITALLIPSLLEQNNEAAEKLADIFLDKWNKKYHKRPLGKANYELILKGFKKKFCFITSATCIALKKGDNCRELNVFRNFRDNWLLYTEDGQEKITEYYLFAPMIVGAINSSGKSEREYKRIWESYLSPCLSLLEKGQNYKCEQKYENMMYELEKKWF